MRLLFAIDNLSSGGAQRQLTSLAIELTRRGHCVEVFVYHADSHFENDLVAAGITVHQHRKRRRFSLSPAWHLRSLFRTGNYELILSFLPVPNTYCLIAAAGLAQRPKIVVSERSFLRPGMEGVRKAILERFYPRADHITVNSHHMREYYARRYGWGPDRVSTIWNGLDLGRFAATPLARRDDEPLRLLCVGRMVPLKNWHLLVEAVGRLRTEGIDVRVSLAGRTDRMAPAEADYFAKIQKSLREFHVEDAWRFLGERTDIAELFATHHVLVHPSTIEGLSNVICESLACGRPAIVGDAFDHRRLIQSGETGWLFDAQSAESLANAIRCLHALPAERLAAMGIAARRFAEEHLTVSRLADEYEALFRRLIDTAAESDPSAKTRGDSNAPSGDSARCKSPGVADVALKR